MSRRPAHGYILKEPGHSFAFVPDPNIRGRWVRTDVAVMIVGCPACGVAPGYPCVNGKGETWASTHYDRRREAKGKKAIVNKTPGIVISLESIG